MSNYNRLGWFGGAIISTCSDCGAVVSNPEAHDNWHTQQATHSHSMLSTIGQLPPPDDSIFRSGGQTKEFGPRPHIATTPPDLT